jgi:hypothetical protein
MLNSTFIERVRFGLGMPSETDVADADILMELWQVVNMYRADLSLAPYDWTIGRFTITVPAAPFVGVSQASEVGNIYDEQPVPVGDFGSAIWIHTIPVTPWQERRTVDIVKADRLSFFYAGPDIPVGTGWVPHVAAAFAFYYTNGTWTVQWRPRHLESAQYLCTYSTGSDTVPPIFDGTVNMPLEEQAWNCVHCVTVNLFPHLADPDKGLDQRQQKLEEIAQQKMARWDQIFTNRKWDGFSHETTKKRKGYGDSETGGWSNG